VGNSELATRAADLQVLRPHRRRNALTGEWVLVSPQRTSRPWLGQVEANARSHARAYDPSCYLCPGNARAGGARNLDYSGAFVFELLASSAQPGACRVLCYSPRHDLTLANMPVAAILGVVDLWAAQTEELGQKYGWVQVFENKGEMMGSSNPHPHGQVWATADLPSQAASEDSHQREYLLAHERPLLVDYAALELSRSERLVAQNEHWLVVVPFWAEWPFETLLTPRKHVPRLPDLQTQQRQSLAEILQMLLVRYDNLFATSFPYSMGWHGAPFIHGEGENRSGVGHWQLHCHFYPPLLRSSTVRKFQVGYELLAEAQRDLTPETAATLLRNLSGIPSRRPRSDGE
jgi:UDPglucose--hexose-1-phosphate uridylyltransferase